MRNSSSYKIDVTPVKKIGCSTIVIVSVLLLGVAMAIKNVGEDSETSTASMSSTIVVDTAPGETLAPTQPQKIFLGEHVAAYKKQYAQEYNPQSGRHFSMGGTPFYRGLTITSNGFAYYNLNDHDFLVVKGEIGCLDDMHPEGEGVLSFYGDDVLLKQIKLKPDKLPASFAIDITGINQLRINCSSTIHWGVKAGLADVSFE